MKGHGDIVYIGYVGGTGGDGVQMLELAAGVAAAGRRVTAVVPERDDTRSLAARYEGRANLQVVVSPRIRFDRASQNPLDVLRLMLPYRNAGILHLHTGDIALPRINLAVLDLLRPPRAVATVHKADDGGMTVGSGRARYWTTVASRRLKRLISPSRHGARRQAGYGLPEPMLTTIYNGVDVARYSGGEGSAVRRSLGIGPDTPLVVFTSRLDTQKRPLDAIEAFARIAADYPDAHLALVGSGDLEPEVRARIAQHGLAERIHLPGRQPNVPDWLAAATVWFLPTEAENFSLAVIEALAAGCAVVSTFCQGNDEVLVEGANALTAPVGDIDGLADALRRALSDASLRERLSAGARATAQNYTINAMVEHHLRLYDEVARGVAAPAAAEVARV